MLYFRKEKKEEVLKGRTIRYLTTTGKIDCTEVHLSNILNGKTPCGKSLAKEILQLAPNLNKEELFIIQ